MSTKMESWRSVGMACFLLAVLSRLGLKPANALMHEYSSERFTKFGNAYFLFGGMEGHWASGPNSKNRTGVANGESFISFDPSLELRRSSVSRVTTKAGAQLTVDALILDLADKKNVGGVGKRDFCCTDALANSTGCQPGELIVHRSPDNPDWPQLRRAHFTDDQWIAGFTAGTVTIPKKGMYMLCFVFCQPELEGLVLSGQTIWKNPGGYLPGEMTSLKDFFGYLSVCYYALGLVWFVHYMKRWREDQQLQVCITAVLALGICGVTTWYFIYADLNATGEWPRAILLWAVTITAVKKTAFRLLLFFVSMGYGDIVPTLGARTLPVSFFGAAYFIATEMLDISDNVAKMQHKAPDPHGFLLELVGILDLFLVLCICASLYTTLASLRAKENRAKLQRYRKFALTLAIALVLAVLWVSYELYLMLVNSFDERWESSWTWPAFWDLVTFLILIVICLLWPPSPHSGYLEVGAGYGYDDQQVVALTIIQAAGAEPEKNSIMVVEQGLPLSKQPLDG